MTSRDLEKEFDATQWSKRNADAKELLQNHIEYGNTGWCHVNIFTAANE
jgi:hypothetical protein